jgi:NADH-quinone oxidoreductase subunit E
MLSDLEKQEIQVELAHGDPKASAVPEALKIVQCHRGWISDEALADVAGLLGMTAEEVDAIATFYNVIFRRAVGRHVILLCDSVSCWAAGYNPIRRHLETALCVAFGQTTPDDRFTLLPVACLGACEQAPAMMVDQMLHGNLTAESVDRILSQYE